MAEDHDANIDHDDNSCWESHEHKVEYFNMTVDMIKLHLAKLKEK